jgi:glycosyltransferase involved in cell wall biosynthesis
MRNIKISVLMAVYKGDDICLFRRALASAYANTTPPDELVLVADGPLTQCHNVVIAEFSIEPGFKLVPLAKNVGLARALNIGLQHVSYELVFRADSDDFNLPHRFARQLEVLNQGADVVGGGIIEVDEKGAAIALRELPRGSEEIRRFARRRNPLNHMTVAFRRQCVLDAGGYPEIHLKEDYALWALLLSRGAKLVNVEDVLVHASAGTKMYERRGGIRYVLSEIALQRHLLRCGLQNPFNALVVGCLRSLVFLMPASLRGIIYVKLLRSKYTY